MTAVRRVTLLVLAVLGLSACGSAGLSELNSARARWNGKKPAAYSFVLQWGCFCPQEHLRPTRILVRDGVIQSVTDAETGAAADPEVRNALTVEALFDRVQEAYTRNAESVEATYDPTYGFTASVRIDYRRTTADDELSWTAKDFTVVP
ncbi:MAG TPA: DUF6174 domain-containing protein [Myxococcaceae bacterium]|nr:DUF6174 domain-containing protein [Myxococcaceae bacterium]